MVRTTAVAVRTTTHLLVTTAEGKMLLHMRTWMMGPETPGGGGDRRGHKGHQF